MQIGDCRSDPIGLICVVLLSIIGIFFIYSAQSYADGSNWKTQILWMVIGVLLYGLISMVDYKFFLKNAHILYAIGIMLLLLLWTPLGKRCFGSLRWLNFGKISIQPSDTAKICTLIFGAGILARSEIGSIKESLTLLMKIGFAFFIPIILIFLQPDLGSALVFPPMIFSLLFAANLDKRFFISVFLVFLLLLGIVAWDAINYHNFLKNNELAALESQGMYEKVSWVPLKDYQRNRILAFVAPEVIDPRGVSVSWNLRQSLISVGSGGFLGKGHNNGTQAKLGYLPQSVAPNDFIFSVIAEEKGFLGGSIVLLLYLVLLINNIRIASISRDRFGMLLCVGISMVTLVHIFVNVGMTIGLMPITGIPLPFISYGGSFMLICFTMQGIIQSVYRFRHAYE
ncbi:MAG: cell cycle protein [Verrucomicrobia bacterium GWC2_42_7]|nr:MAG: cell cycle protein [Verrucomicrobia bacterium GWC2_42_7]